MSENGVGKLTARELRQLLGEVEQLNLNNEQIQPLSEEEVAEIEASYQAPTFSAEREERHRAQLEELRQAWLSRVEMLKGIFPRANEIGLSRRELARRLRLGRDVLLKLELHLVTDFPVRLARRLADTLDVDIRSVVVYLAQQGTDMNQLAAASRDRPAAGEPQTWEEAILSSDMPDEDKEYWLEETMNSR